MTDKQSDTLHLAGIADDGPWTFVIGVRKQIAAELRRQYAEIETLRTGYAAARLEIESLRGRGWVNLPGQLPEPGKPVLLDIGKKYPIRAMWAAKHTVEAHDEADADWGEYDEATDMLYSPEGWYEWNEHEEVHWAVTETPRAWRALAAGQATAAQQGAAYAELPDAPLSVFSKGPWTFKETGQNFSGAELDEAAFVAYRDRASHGQAPPQEAQEPVAVVVPCYTPSGKRVALYSAKQDLPIGTQLYTSPQPSPAAQEGK